MKKSIILPLAASILLSVFTIPVFAAANGSFGWYVKPTTDGTAPQVIPEAASFLDDHDVIYTDKSGKKTVYLTFDAGYANENLVKILDVLKEKQVPGAFFVLPQIAKHDPDLLKRMKDEGHVIGNHTTHHRDMSRIGDLDSFKEELSGCEASVKEVIGVSTDAFYRPPEGRFSEQNLAFADKLGYTTVFWDLAYADWDNKKQMPPADALSLILSRTHPGAVVLLHPTSSTNAAILGDYIDALRAKGYEFRSLNDFQKKADAA